MVLYLSIIGIATLIISIINSIFAAPVFNLHIWQTVLFTILAVIIVFTIDAIIAVAVRAFPAKNFDHTKKVFKEGKFEKKFYLKIGIKKWKDKIPETGKLIKVFDKTKIDDANNPKYLYKFICELGYAEIMHVISIFAGFLAIFAFPLSWWYLFAFPAALVNAFLQTLPIFVQRYNRPKLIKLYERSLRNTSITEKE